MLYIIDSSPEWGANDLDNLPRLSTAQLSPPPPEKARFFEIDPQTRKAAGARLRELLSEKAQRRFIAFVLAVSEEQPHCRVDTFELLDRVEAEACIAVNMNDPEITPTGRMVLAALSAEPEGCKVVLSNIAAFWETGELPHRWTA